MAGNVVPVLSLSLPPTAFLLLIAINSCIFTTGVKPFAGDKLRYMVDLHRNYAFVLVRFKNQLPFFFSGPSVWSHVLKGMSSSRHISVNVMSHLSEK